MEQKDSFKGFDFEQIWAISPHEEYTLPILKELPTPIVENITDFAGGNGTFYNPYKISTKAHLNNVRNYTNANFIMIDDIAFAASDFALDGEYYNEGKGWIPICRDRYDVDFDYFSGVFDGNGHTVANLYSKGEYAGLFGANYGTIKDLGVINGDINGQASAGITVTNELTGQILNCYFTGKIFAEESAGGICASSGALINNCYSTAEVVSNGSAGGIVSFAYNSKGISDCFFSGSVSGKEAGGIAGGTTLTNIVNSVNVGTVKGNLMVGGLVGRLGGSVINNSVNLGIVKDGTYKGAIAGYCDGPINNCYYNDIGLRATSWHVTGEINAKYLTSLQFKQKSSYPTFNFNEIWRLDEGMEYPMLKLML
ncbi:MAG: hypothetical protein GX818_00330 [Tissierellia bacterium]|nr:hypothetical protein [Tissierellia bacterium]